MKKFVYILALYLAGIFTGMAQSPLIDSLNKRLLTEKDKKVVVDIYNELHWEYRELGDTEKEKEFSGKAEKLAMSTRYDFGLAKHYNCEGVGHMNRAEYAKAEACFFKSIELLKQLKEEKSIASAYGNLGIIYFNQAQYKKALAIQKKSLAIRKKLKDTYGMGASYINIANIYESQGNFPKALEYNFKSLQCFEKLKDDGNKASCYANIGIVYAKQGNHAKGEEWFAKSMKLRKKAGDQYGLSNDLANLAGIKKNKKEFKQAIVFIGESSVIKLKIGDVFGLGSNYMEAGDCFHSLAQESKNNDPKNYKFLLDSATKYAHKAFTISNEINDPYLQSYCLNLMAHIEQEYGNDEKALTYLKQSQKISDALETPENMSHTLRQISDISARLGNYKDAYEFYVKQDLIHDSLFNKTKSMELGKLEAGFTYEKKLLKKQQEKEQSDLLHNERVRVLTWSFSGGLLLLLVIIFVVYRSYAAKKKANQLITEQKKEVELQKVIIEVKNKEIVDSINYAKRIQTAVITSDTYLKQHLDDYFVLFLPKDIVAGDFYWSIETDAGILMATGDCTGHGVPGAFMSMMGINFLNEIVVEKKIIQPAAILNELRSNIIRALNPEGTVEEGKDGMDISLYLLDKKSLKLTFAAANNPVWIINENGILEIKGDKMPVGKYSGKENESFTTKTHQLKKGDVIYTFTDGFADQFGGEKGKKFKYSNLQKILLDIYKDPLAKQEESLKSVFETWKGNFEQTDDVCVVGVRI